MEELKMIEYKQCLEEHNLPKDMSPHKATLEIKKQYDALNEELKHQQEFISKVQDCVDDLTELADDHEQSIKEYGYRNGNVQLLRSIKPEDINPPVKSPCGYDEVDSYCEHCCPLYSYNYPCDYCDDGSCKECCESK